MLHSLYPVSSQRTELLQTIVCLDGSPPAYYFEPGFGEGIENWIVQLPGGGWCNNVTSCLRRSNGRLGSSKSMPPMQFQGIHSKNQTANPDFYNWNKVIVAYCDGGSFIGNAEYVDPATNLHFRGARIYTAVMEELLAKGLKNAKNAILAGSSAGSYPAILYCDRFRNLLPSTSRVKCLIDSGYFESAKTLPKSCTSKMKPELIQYTLRDGTDECIKNGTCTTRQNNTIQEMRSDFLNALPKGNPKLRGVFIDVVPHHTCIITRWTPENATVVHKRSAPKAFADWYFDRNYTYLIDEHNLPLPNIVPNVTQ
ncbi:hypothetical protein RND71_004610 [Anisodus tanguticus]|uniref:Pectin acetylesterase n=1 Tax=Anisodus tanguticus TaxID=243964 RepID=A0AAE1SME9_9SOLA|nr:hypothetical protein RND71_004610 [Anisodus tanguticus]